MDIRLILAMNLKGFRDKRGFSQEELAYRSRVDRTYISALERCIYSASIDVLDRIAIALDISAFELLINPKIDKININSRERF